MNIYQYDNILLIKLFKALSDENRIRILRVLISGTFNVNEIFYIVKGKQSNISHHLKILSDSGIVKTKKEGSWIYYSINQDAQNTAVTGIIDIINKESRNIPYFEDDIKRLETIFEKRKKNAENFFNSIGSGLDSVQDDLFKDIYSIKEILSLFDDKMDAIIDIGCGTGKNLTHLADYAKKVIGVDSSPIMLQLSEHICKNSNIDHELKLSDIQNLNFPDDSVNGAFINMVLHHLSEPQHALNEIFRILKDNGQLILIDLLQHDHEIFRDKYADLWLGFSQEELINWIKKAGFSINHQDVKNNDKYKVIIIKAVKNSILSR